jgi:hypothetical protein
MVGAREMVYLITCSDKSEITKPIVPNKVACPEHLRLQEEYAKALEAWRASGPELVSLGYPIHVRSKIRRAALESRLKAANALYLHTVTCRQCDVAIKR